MRFDIHRYESVTSTMDVCRNLAEQGAEEGIVVVADEQTAGRGRAGRAWYSPPGQSLYVSILLRPNLQPRQIGWLTMIGALAVRDVTVGASDSDAPTPRIAIKWFNDVLLNGRKVAGVLVESSLTGEHLDYAVLGIGLNVNTDFAHASDDVKARTTSLREVFGCVFDREAILQSLLNDFGQRYALLAQTGTSPTAEYAKHVETLGKTVRLCVGDEIIDGCATRIEDDGVLIVQTHAGERRIRLGDVLS